MTASATTAANPTIAINFTNTWPLTPILICKMVGGTGAVANVTGETYRHHREHDTNVQRHAGLQLDNTFNCHGE